APDGKLVLSQGRQENRLWEGETGRPVPLWGGLTKAVNPFTFTTFGSTLAAVVWEKDKERIRLVNPVTGEEIRLLPWAAADSSCVAPDGKTVVTIRGENRAPGQFRFILSVWNNETKSWRDLFEDVGPPPIHPFQFSADSKILAFHGNDAAVRVWDVAGAKLLLQLLGNNQRDEAVALSPNGKLLAKEDRAAKKVRVWEVSTGKELPELPPYQPKPNGVGELAFSSDGKTLAGIDDRSTIRLWDVVARKKVRDIQANTSRIEQLVFTGDGKRLYVADGNGVSVWDPQTGKPLDDYGGHRYAISGVAWSLDGKWVTSGAGYADNVGRVWDSVTGRKVLDLIGHQIGIECVAYSPDGSLLATGSQDGTARLWNAATGKELHSFEAKDRMVYALAFSPDGQFLVTGGEKALHVWDVAGRKEARTILHPADLTLQILFIRGGQRMLVRDYKAGTRVIDFATGRDEVRLVVGGRRSSAAAVSLDGQLIALADDEGIIRLADAFTGREIRLLAVPVTKELDARDVMGLDFSPDGRTLAVAYSLGEVHVYEVATGSDRFRFLGHVDAALGVKFSPDGTRLCSFADDHTLLIWDVTGTRLASAPPPKNVDTAWADLESPDAGKGFAAIRYLAGDPTSAVRLVAEGVKPVAFVDAKVVAALIQKLGSPEFQDREGASKELAVFAPAVVDQLREAAGKSESPEVRTRLQTILARVDVTKLTGERLRAARAVEVLERIGSAEARKVLSGLVAGAPGAELTRNAAASIARMGGTK
ncbi:MAG TPA: PQQ-binding-like beta-propeller repeat protein, partial [Gemmata sp.]|nr:PQQ-binding-like beta-propeller repeat protein [Gemmata sp.]